MVYRQPIKAVYISTYPPQKCGIATFTKDVTNAINLLNRPEPAEIAAVVKSDEEPEFPGEVKYLIKRDEPATYTEAADKLNRSRHQLVVVEHEFGIFGGPGGEYILEFLKLIQKPVVICCHTMIEDPTNEWGRVFQKIVEYADGFIVMSLDGVEKLQNIYGVPGEKIIFIPHGAPDLPLLPTAASKAEKGLENRLVLGNINLLSSNKGIEDAIEAMSIIVKTIPEAMYLVIGQTHPNIKKMEGEKYRRELKTKIKQMGLGPNFRFVNKYLTLEELTDWLLTIDIYITPYLNRNQITSGALAYAAGAGKPCISTRYLYAEELLAQDRGILVPFHDPKAIAAAVIKLWKDQKFRDNMSRKVYNFSRFMTWPNVARQHLQFFEEILNRYGRPTANPLSY